jgi:hypothetical protein
MVDRPQLNALVISRGRWTVDRGDFRVSGCSGNPNGPFANVATIH